MLLVAVIGVAIVSAGVVVRRLTTWRTYDPSGDPVDGARWLEQQLSAASPEKRKRAIRDLVPEESTWALPILAKVTASDPSPIVREEAVRVYVVVAGGTCGSACQGTIIAALRDPDRMVREAAAQMLFRPLDDGSWDAMDIDPELPAELLRLAREPEGLEVAAVAIGSLGRHGRTVLRGLITEARHAEALGTLTVAGKQEVLEAVGRLRSIDPEALEFVLESSRSDGWGFQAAAAYALGRLCKDLSAAEVASDVSESQEVVLARSRLASALALGSGTREAAARGISHARWPCPEYLPQLIDIITVEPGSSTASPALSAMERMGPDAAPAVGPLGKLLPIEPCDWQPLDVLASIGPAARDAVPDVLDFMRLLDRRFTVNPEPCDGAHVWFSACRAVQAIDETNPEALSLVKDGLRHPSVRIRAGSAAGYGLLAPTDRPAVEALVGLACKEKDEEILEIYSRGLGSLDDRGAPVRETLRAWLDGRANCRNDDWLEDACELVQCQEVMDAATRAPAEGE